eukprot:scaffold480403_cov39-Prasinocladus_malaysianus.AAC.1
MEHSICRVDSPLSRALVVADKAMTVCRWDGPGGIRDMEARMPSVSVREWPGAAHSIHNTACDGFVKAVMDIVDGCSCHRG